MNNNNNSKVIIIGIVAHIQPDKIPEFLELLQNLPYFRLIRKETSDNKIWLQVEGKND
jgi:hypothetical protein